MIPRPQSLKGFMYQVAFVIGFAYFLVAAIPVAIGMLLPALIPLAILIFVLRLAVFGLQRRNEW